VLELVSREDRTMSSMTMIESHHSTGIPILTNPNDEEFGEKIVALFIAHANALR